MKKLNWLELLMGYFQSCKDKDFEWGTFDCCLFTSDCCMVMTDKDPAALYRGRYTTELGAKRVLASEHGSLAAAFGALYSEVPPAMAQRGDVVLFNTDLGLTAGIKWMDVVWTVSLNGIVAFKPDEILQAWRVE